MDTSVFTREGKYLMLALDHRGSFRKMINSIHPDSVSSEEATNLKQSIIKTLHSHFTGLLIDFEYGYNAYKNIHVEKRKPFLLCLEKSGYKQVGEDRITELETSSAKIKSYGASGTKLLVYINPESNSTLEQVKISKSAVSDSHFNNLPIFLEIVTYNSKDPARVGKSVSAFLENKVIPDVFKLEYPGSPEECKKVTNLCGAVPWIMLTRGDTFDDFSKKLQVAVANGCRGFLAGRALWQELITLYNDDVKEEFLETTLPGRFEILNNIVNSYRYT